MVTWQEEKNKNQTTASDNDDPSSEEIDEEQKRQEQENAEYLELMKLKKNDPLQYYSLKINKKSDLQKESVKKLENITKK